MRVWGQMIHRQGFTLVELLIAIAVLGVVLAIGVPTFQNTVINRRLDSAASQFVNALVTARSEAARRGVTITLRPITANNWAGGWEVVLANNTVLQRFDGARNTTLTNLGNITFSATGIRGDFATNGTTPTMKICDTMNSSAKGIQLTLNATGGYTRSAIASGCTP